MLEDLHDGCDWTEAEWRLRVKIQIGAAIMKWRFWVRVEEDMMIWRCWGEGESIELRKDLELGIFGGKQGGEEASGEIETDGKKN